jgi:hypothetical protein
MSAIPFLIDDACGGFAHCHGLIRDEGETLVIEFQTQDAIAGVIKTEVREARIPLKEIAGITLHQSWFGFSNKLALQLASMKQVTSLPGMRQGKILLPIARVDRDAAQRLVTSICAYLSKGGTLTPQHV